MKLLLSTSAFLVVVFFISLGGGLSSCKKETIYDTVTIAKEDTMLTTEILTGHPWKIQEERGVLGGQILYYLRGGSSNTESFDNEYTTFNADNTGVMVDNSMASHVISHWDFANPEHTKIVFTMYNYPNITSVYTWDNIRYKKGNLYLDQYFTENVYGENAHSQQIRIPK